MGRSGQPVQKPGGRGCTTSEIGREMVISDSSPACGGAAGTSGITRRSGYGYNWGPIGWRGGGLLGTQLRNAAGRTYLEGVSIAAIDSPAGTFAFGDTYDTPRMTLGIGFAGDVWNGTAGALNGNLAANRHRAGRRRHDAGNDLQ